MLVHRNRYTAVCVDVVADVLGLWFVQFWSHFCSLLFLFSTRRAPAPRAGPAASRQGYRTEARDHLGNLHESQPYRYPGEEWVWDVWEELWRRWVEEPTVEY